MAFRRTFLAGAITLLLLAPAALAVPELTPDDPTREGELVVKDHAVSVVIQNGFAMTEVRHTFLNRGSRDLEATYSFPVPKSASLAEMSIVAGETEIHGEVLTLERAKQAYEEERAKGNNAGLATKHGYQRFAFRVARVPAGQETQMRFVYYQPLSIDAGVGRYLYPLEDGGTDEGESFWKPDDRPVEGTFSFHLELKSAWPVADVRLPGFEQDSTVKAQGEGHYQVTLDRQTTSLDRDVVFYYRLAEDLPGRVELIPYRADRSKPGTFMLVVTPGLDLKPITGGRDFTFVLDVSGSMEGKIGTLTRGVARAIEDLEPTDRVRLVAFSDVARDLTGGFVAATPEGVAELKQKVTALTAEGGTDLYKGITLGLTNLDADRVQSVVLVTDAVTNKGVLAPRRFHDLMKQSDVRVFGFLLGNNANWPLMKAICDASGGFWSQVSNGDDILGQLMLAKGKITHECLHGADLRVGGVKVYDTTDPAIGKVYRGQQLVFFGRYDAPGRANLRLYARRTGEDKVYSTSFEFPEIDTANPEIERLWALHRIEAIEAMKMLEMTPPEEARQAVADLGVQYQLVTDETAMVVMSDASFEERGIERRNRDRTARERTAQVARNSNPARNRRVDDEEPMFDRRPAPGVGGGAIDPISGLLALGLAAAGAAAARRRRRKDVEG